MFKPVQIQIDWQGPHSAADAFDPTTSPSLNAECPGVYLHVITPDKCSVIATYLGKHQSSLTYRQWEHFQSYMRGDYNLFAVDGKTTFFRDNSLPSNFEQLLIDHLSSLYIFFGKISVNGYTYQSIWPDIAESLLQRSPAWKTNGGKIINYRHEKPVYQWFNQCKIEHIGADLPIHIFGKTTTWDKTKNNVF